MMLFIGKPIGRSLMISRECCFSRGVLFFPASEIETNVKTFPGGMTWKHTKV